MSDDTPRFESFRRDVLKAIGAGGALAALGGSASAALTGGRSNRQVETPEAGDNTVHVVRTVIGPPTNPERPADFYYQPTGLQIEPGDVVKWVFESPDHNITSYHPAFGMQRRVPSGVQPFSSPLLGWDPASLPDDIDEPPAEPGAGVEEGPELSPPASPNATATPGEETPAGPAVTPRPNTWLYAFETPGVYDIECAPHETYGMAMRIVVGDETETAFETSDPDALPEPRAGPVGLSRVTLTDPALEPEAIAEAGEVLWEDLEANQPAATPEETPEEETPEEETPEEETPAEVTPEETPPEPPIDETPGEEAPAETPEETATETVGLAPPGGDIGTETPLE